MFVEGSYISEDGRRATKEEIVKHLFCLVWQAVLRIRRSEPLYRRVPNDAKMNQLSYLSRLFSTWSRGWQRTGLPARLWISKHLAGLKFNHLCLAHRIIRTTCATCFPICLTSQIILSPIATMCTCPWAVLRSLVFRSIDQNGKICSLGDWRSEGVQQETVRFSSWRKRMYVETVTQ